MYLEFFGLEAKPFHTTPDPYFLFLGTSHKQALGSIIYGVREKKGFIAITGQVGLGKTTILRSFLSQIDQTNQQTIYLLNPNLSFSSVLKTLLRELGHDLIKGDDAELVEQLHMILIEEYQKGRTVVLLIDEAQNMPVATLEHLRMLSNLETPKDKLIQIVLLGQPELDSLLDRYELRQIRQRIAVRAIIHPLSQQESVQYIQHRLEKAGAEGKKVFTNSALGLIAQEAQGIPRRLNIICDNALVTALGHKKTLVTARIAKEVIADLTGQASFSLWKLIPLAAGTFILVLAVFALMPLTHFQFSDSLPLNEIGQLIDYTENPNQDFLNLGEDTNPSDNGKLSFVTNVQNWLETSIPKVLDTFQSLTSTDSDSNVTHLDQEVDLAFENHSEVVIAKNLINDFKDSISVASERPNALSIRESASGTSSTPEKQGFDSLDQSKGFLPEEEQHLSIEKSQLVQLELEPLTDYTIGTNAAIPSPEKLHNRSIEKTRNLIERQENVYKQDILTPIKMKPKKSQIQKSTNKKLNVVAAPLPVIKIIKEGDTLTALMKEVYGSANSSTLRMILNHNQHIMNVRKVFPGQQVLFPSLNHAESPEISVSSGPTLAAYDEEIVKSSKKIFSQSSVSPSSNQKKDGPHRTLPYAVAIVKEGDTLEKLSKIIYGSSDPLYIQRVLDYNPEILNPQNITPGQNIAFPKMVDNVKSQALQ